ncbi:MAG: dienelactone hydrolase family protein [Novosphingobium sp.]|nr:dienelactone hydrolase family protein [Novosphingobium sp.]
MAIGPDDLEPVICEHEGHVLRGRVAIPSTGGRHPGVLVLPNAFGLGPDTCEVASRLAGEGYLAIAADIYGEGAYSEDHEEIGKLVAPLWGNSERLRERMGVWHDVLKGRPDVLADRIAAIGYCFGGQCVLEFARGGAEVRAVVSFHGILTTDCPAEPDAVRAFVSVHTGGRDPHVPASDVAALREELTAAGASWQISEYGDAFHAFTEKSAASPETGRAYDPLADRMSWASTVALLEARLK